MPVPETLNNKRILVTRPREQAGHLCELIVNRGGKAILFPTIEIQAITNSETISACFDKINEYDIIIFISRNAVNITFDHYLDNSKSLERAKIFAIGSASADVLARFGVVNVFHAGTQANTETLLKNPELQEDKVYGKQALIIRGTDGRELLSETLKNRGASVEYAEVYKRCLPQYNKKDVKEIWQDINPDAVIVTSNDGLENLVTITLEEDKQHLFRIPLITMSKRAAEFARETGFVSKIRFAKFKNDEGLLSALLELVGD